MIPSSSHVEPSVFILYVRKYGKQFAQEPRKKLEDENFPLPYINNEMLKILDSIKIYSNPLEESRESS